MKRSEALSLYASIGNASEVARQVGVNRVTVYKWLKEAKVESKPSDLSGLVEKAIQVLGDALDGKKVTPSAIRASIEVVRASNALKAAPTDVTQSLFDIIGQLDKDSSVESD